MALLFMDSFDHYATADVTTKWTTSGIANQGAQALGTGTGRRASNSWRLTCQTFNNCQAYLQKTLSPVDVTTCLLGFAITVPSGLIGTAGLPIAAIRDGATSQVTLRLNADFTLTVLRGANGATVLGTTGSAPLSAGIFAYVEWKVVIHPSAGTVDLKVNGASVLSLTTQNTRASGVSQWTSVILGIFDTVADQNIATTKNIDYDDLYVLDGSGAAPWNTFLGDCRVDTRLPTAAGATTAWTPLAGANWDAVNDTAPDGDTTYTSTSTVGATDTFVTQDAPVVGAIIFGVQHCLNLKKMDAGTCTVAPVIRHSGVDYPGADLAPSTAYAYGLQIAATNPGTGAAWTEAGFNAAEFGYKRTS